MAGRLIGLLSRRTCLSPSRCSPTHARTSRPYLRLTSAGPFPRGGKLHPRCAGIRPIFTVVKSVLSAGSRRCPLYPREQTSVSATAMSALCQKQTLRYPTSFDASVYNKCLAILARHLQMIEDTRVLDCLPIL